MRKRARRFSALASLVFIAGLAVPATEAGAAHAGNYTVQVSNPILVGNNCNQETARGCRFGESMRFLSPALNVHQGDTITFDFAGFHTASALPVGQDWIAFRGSQTGGIDKPYSLLVTDPDDTTEEGVAADKPAVKVNPAVAFRNIGGVPATCGTPEDPCDYDGTKVINSGAPEGPPPQTFTLRINATPGQSFWVMCFIHTHMALRVNVVADSTATTTQEAIDTTKASQIALDQEWAASTDAKLANKVSSHTTSSGQKVFDVMAGAESHFANLNAFYPLKLSVPKGSTVRYHFSDLVYEDHTATLPTPAGFSLFEQFFAFMCDTDGDAGAGPDTADPGEAGPPCGGDFSKLEIDISSAGMWGTGNGTFTGSSDIESSGVRGANFSLAPFDVKYRARSNKKGWRTFCLIHGPGMSNRVVVKPTL